MLFTWSLKDEIQLISTVLISWQFKKILQESSGQVLFSKIEDQELKNSAWDFFGNF